MTDLQQIQKYYEQNLCDRVFQYSLTNGTVLQVIFYREALCHLLGIQHITNNRRYIGRRGYERIRSGELTIQRLKEAKYVLWIVHFLFFGKYTLLPPRHLNASFFPAQRLQILHRAPLCVRFAS